MHVFCLASFVYALSAVRNEKAAWQEFRTRQEKEQAAFQDMRIRQEYAGKLFEEKVLQKQRELGINGLQIEIADGRNVIDLPDGIFANGVCCRIIDARVIKTPVRSLGGGEVSG